MRRGANLLALLWTLTVAAFFLLGPVYGTASARTTSPDGAATPLLSSDHLGLLAVNGWSALIPVTIPVFLGLVPLLLRSPVAKRRALAAAAIGLGVFVLLGALTIGLFYVPALVALVVAWTHPSSKERRTAHP